MKHIACNLVTLEVVTCERACDLRRRVAQITRWNVAHGYREHRWVFAHGSEGMDKLCERYFREA